MKYGNLVILILALIGCSSEPAKIADKEVVEVVSIETQLKELTVAWNDRLNVKTCDSLEQMYDDSVLVYGKIGRKDMLDSKKRFFAKHADFTQTISGEILIEKKSNELYVANFKKTSGFNGKTSTVDAYLTFSNKTGNWKISVEGDKLTDANLLKEAKKTSSEVTCMDVVEEIITTCPSYLKMTKGLAQQVEDNGGVGFGHIFEGSPNGEKGDDCPYTEMYEFNLHEYYATHSPTLARYSFNPNTKELFEYNPIDDQLFAIPFNKKLIEKFDKACK